MTPDQSLCRVRAITAFINLHHDRALWKEKITQATLFCGNLSDRFEAENYDVQSIRIVTNPFGEYLNTDTIKTAKNDLNFLSDLLHAPDMPDIRIRFAIGEARTAHELSLLPELIKEHGDLCNACINIEADMLGVMDNTLLEKASETIAEIGAITPRGEGNFNFTVNFNCTPLIPYFPASYHRNEQGDCFVVGLETPDLLADVLRNLKTTTNHNDHFQQAYRAMTGALQDHVDVIVAIANQFDQKQGFTFAGIDSSAAPSKNCASMVEIYKLLGVEYFGAAGTVEASSLLTKVFKSVQGVDLVGFSGLMLAVTEDTGLAEATRNGEFGIHALLTFSAVCGIGLDTVPIPGNTPNHKITAIMRDTGTMAFRLNKPLTVRLFPVPGLSAGDITAFESEDLCNCAVLAVP